MTIEDAKKIYRDRMAEDAAASRKAWDKRGRSGGSTGATKDAEMKDGATGTYRGVEYKVVRHEASQKAHDAGDVLAISAGRWSIHKAGSGKPLSSATDFKTAMAKMKHWVDVDRIDRGIS